MTAAADGARGDAGWRYWALRVGPALLWAAAIFLLSAQPDLPRADRPLLDLLLKKGAHALGYAVFAVLLCRAVGASARQRDRRVLLAWALAVLYAVSDEWHQSFVPGRSAAATDVVIDGTGAAVGLLLWSALADWWRRHSPAPATDRTGAV